MLTRRELLGAGAGAVTAAGLLGVGLTVTERRFRRPRYFPNCVLRTHEGREVRFYDDLLKGKAVAINMMYAKCEGICPRMTENLLEVQERLGDALGRDVFMYSITLQPAHDTPEVLLRYTQRQVSTPRWPFLTGAPADIELIRRTLGFYDNDPEVDMDKRQHTGMVRIGNEPLERWSMTPALGKPAQIAAAILRIRGIQMAV